VTQRPVTERTGQAAGRAIVVGLGTVDPALVADPLGRATFVASPRPEDLAAAAGAIVRADAVVDRALLGRMPNLRVLARTGVGVDLVDVAAATERGIAVVITPGSGTRAVAEAVIGMALHLAKRFGPLTELVRGGGWARRHQVAVGDLEGSTIGIVGYGRIGQRVGELARAFGMRVLAYDPVAIPPDSVRCARLSDIAASSDVITLHTPLTEATRHLVNGRFLSTVKPGAVLINCGRGALIDADAVLDAMLAGQLSGVGLDVFDPEPPAHHPLFDHPDVVLTPHLMGLSRRAAAATFADAARGVADVLAGRRPAALANPGWMPAPRPDHRLAYGETS
jgi:D-3-phosphoglycerate dehydrogenase